MSETDTTKVVGLDFTVKGQANEQAERMAKSFEHVHGAVDRASHKFSEFGHHTAVSALGAIGLSFGFHAIAEKAKEANLEIDGSVKKLAGVQYAFGNWKAGTAAQEKWNASMEAGREIVDRLEESEGKLKMQRSELAGIYKSTTALAERHGLTMEQQLDLTEKLGAVERVLGVNAQAASMQISRMALTGNLRGFDDFSKSMRFSIGNLKEFAKLSETERFKRIQKAMGDLVPAAEAMGKGLSGAMFDMREAVEDITRDVTGPVFKEVTKEVSTWAKHLTEARESGKSISREIGDKLVTAFGYLKSTTSFIADHWKSIALVVGATKATGWMEQLAGWGKGGAGHAGGGLSGSAGAMTVNAGVVNVNQTAAAALGKTVGAGAQAALKPGFRGVIGGMAGMVGKIGLVTEALGLLYVAASGVAKAVDTSQTKSILWEANFGKNSAIAGRAGNNVVESMMRFRDRSALDQKLGRSSMEAAQEAKAALTAFKAAYGPGVIAGGKVNVAGAREAYGAMDPSTRRQQLQALGLDSSFTNAETQGKFAEKLAQVFAGLVQTVGKPEEQSARLTGKRDIKINVQHLEITQDFKQADPDRIFHRIPNQIAEMVFAPHASNLPMVPE